jgi:sugar/nucleoside kinase (ribokinase family)
MDSIVTASGELIPPTCGGNALYAAAGARIWSDGVGLVARAGRDYPADCLGTIGAAVDITGVRRLDIDHPLHVAFAYRQDGSRSRVIPRETLASMAPAIRHDFIDDTGDDARYLSGTPGPEDIPATWLGAARGFHIPALLTQSHRRLIDAMRAAQPGCVITVDAPWFSKRDGTVEQELELLDRVDAVLPSEDDVRPFRPAADVVDAVRDLVRTVARAAVVKIGAAGSLVVDERAVVTHVPAYPTEAVDPTGAGDSFCGGFLVGFDETRDPLEAALYGTIAASFVVEHRSALPVFAIGRDEAEARLAALRSRVRVGIESDPRRAVA